MSASIVANVFSKFFLNIFRAEILASHFSPEDVEEEFRRNIGQNGRTHPV
jgi:hypothetical protein